MEDSDNYSDNYDQLDNISDDKLWDILDNFTQEQEQDKEQDQEHRVGQKQDLKISDKYNKFCAGCKSVDLIFTSSRGSYVCEHCGLESQEILDEGPEWNNYEDGKVDSGRCGAPINAFFPKSSLGTTINAPGYSKVKMLRNWGQVPYRERSLAEVLNDIDSKCKKYKITKAVIDNAKILYKNIRETKHKNGANKGKNVIIRGINRKQIIAACFYFGAILQKYPRSTKEVADIFNLELKQVSKGCRRFLEIMKDNFIVFDIKPSHGTDFIERFGSKIKLTKDTIQLAKQISENTTKLDIASDHQATSVAAASILLAANILEQNINKKLISEVFKISDVTITKTYKKIYPFQKVVISDEKTNKLYHKMNIKFMTNNIDFELNDLEIDTETETETETEIEIETETDDLEIDTNNNIDKKIINFDSETDQLIKKLYAIDLLNISESSNSEFKTEEFIVLSDTELDESDIVKKDNIQSKKNKIIELQKDRDKKKEIKQKNKDDKEREKKREKDEKKREKEERKNTSIYNKYYIIDPSDITENNVLIKRKRGRPKNSEKNIINNLNTNNLDVSITKQISNFSISNIISV
jgi:transcription initiation factor TFIIB